MEISRERILLLHRKKLSILLFDHTIRFRLSVFATLFYRCSKLHTSVYSKVLIARLAQSVEHQTLNLRVVGSSPTLGEFLYVTKLLRRRNKRIKGIVEVHGSLLLPNLEKVTKIVPSLTPVVQKLTLYLVYAIWLWSLEFTMVFGVCDG